MSWYKDKIKDEYKLENEKEGKDIYKQDVCSTRDEKQKSFLDEMVEETRVENKVVKKRGRKPGFRPQKKAMQNEVENKPKPDINFDLMTAEITNMKDKLKKYQEQENDSKVFLEFMEELSSLADRVYDKISEESDYARKIKLYRILSDIQNIVIAIARIVTDMR